MQDFIASVVISGIHAQCPCRLNYLVASRRRDECLCSTACAITAFPAISDCERTAGDNISRKGESVGARSLIVLWRYRGLYANDTRRSRRRCTVRRKWDCISPIQRCKDVQRLAASTGAVDGPVIAKVQRPGSSDGLCHDLASRTVTAFPAI